MYMWRKLTPEQRKEVLRYRKFMHRPWHSPPHVTHCKVYHFCAANYEHKNIIGSTIKRMSDFQSLLLNTLYENKILLHAWVIMPNHYHLLLETTNFKDFLKLIAKIHGKTSKQWNTEDQTQGRRVWFRSADRYIRTERHFFVTMNYIHHNPVRHGYTEKWQEWPFSSAKAFINDVGKEHVLKLWKEYPLLDYGEGWDEI